VDPKVKQQQEKQAVLDFHKSFADSDTAPSKENEEESSEFVKKHCISTTQFNKSVVSFYTQTFKNLMTLSFEHGKRAGQPLLFPSSEAEGSEEKEFSDKDLKALQDMFSAKLEELYWFHKYARRTPPDASTASKPENMRGPYKPAYFGDSPITDFLKDPNVKLGQYTINGETFALKAKIPNILRGFHLGVTTANMIFNIYYSVNKLKDTANGRGAFIKFSDDMRKYFGDKDCPVLYTKKKIGGKLVKAFTGDEKISTFDALESISSYKETEDGEKDDKAFDQSSDVFAGYNTRTIISLNTIPVDKLMEEWTLAGNAADADSLNSPLELQDLKSVNDALHDKKVLAELLNEYHILNDVTKYIASLKDGKEVEIEEEFIFEDDEVDDEEEDE
jgi:hypothetical protein